MYVGIEPQDNVIVDEEVIQAFNKFKKVTSADPEVISKVTSEY